MKRRKRIPGGIFALVIALAILARTSLVITHTTVYGNSMQPTMEDGDHLIINRLSYLNGKPERFDIVIFPYQYKSDTYYIKRVIGLPGERIRINEDGIIYVNGNILIEHYGNAAIMDGGLASKEIILAEDEYFVLGDNRNDSTDSRDPEVANIKEGDIVGKAWACIWPFERWGTFQ
ncbi:MAG: signal peptidase I [Eubacteriales bacterium]|nr:signal peptidase I [Eubacteriales bacterium]